MSSTISFSRMPNFATRETQKTAEYSNGERHVLTQLLLSEEDEWKEPFNDFLSSFSIEDKRSMAKALALEVKERGPFFFLRLCQALPYFHLTEEERFHLAIQCIPYFRGQLCVLLKEFRLSLEKRMQLVERIAEQQPKSLAHVIDVLWPLIDVHHASAYCLMALAQEAPLEEWKTHLATSHPMTPMYLVTPLGQGSKTTVPAIQQDAVWYVCGHGAPNTDYASSTESLHGPRFSSEQIADHIARSISFNPSLPISVRVNVLACSGAAGDAEGDKRSLVDGIATHLHQRGIMAEVYGRTSDVTIVGSCEDKSLEGIKLTENSLSKLVHKRPGSKVFVGVGEQGEHYRFDAYIVKLQLYSQKFLSLCTELPLSIQERIAPIMQKIEVLVQKDLLLREDAVKLLECLQQLSGALCQEPGAKAALIRTIIDQYLCRTVKSIAPLSTSDN